MLTKDAIIEKYPNGQIEWRIPIEWYTVGVYRFHGEAIQYYPTGEVKIRKTYEHGVIVGEEILYKRDGSVVSRIPFQNGKRHGTHVYIYPDGSREEATYEDGELKEGSQKKLDKHGKEKGKRPNVPQRDGETGAKKILPGDFVPPALR